MNKDQDGGLISERLRRKRKSRAKMIQTDEEDEVFEVHDIKKGKKKQKISQISSLLKSFTELPSLIEESKPKTKRREASIPKELKSEVALVTASTDDQWIDKYKPTSSTSTAIHGKKLKDVRTALESMLLPNSHIKLLILSGPSGASKSTVIKHLAQELIHTEIPLIEWFNPLETYPTQFEDFLLSVKYRIGKNKSLVLVEDLPNVFHQETRDSFRRALLELINIDHELPPLVLCITECDFSQNGDRAQYYNIENNYTVETIVGRKILNTSTVRRIKFNPINVTLIKKFLKMIWDNESKIFKEIPKMEIHKKISELSTFGDIRAAISAFQFWASLRSKNDIDLSLCKQSKISIFHAIGKILFGTKEDEPESVTMDRIMKDFSNHSDTLMLGLLENYQKFTKMDYPISVSSEVANNLSWSDCLKPNSYALECAIRSTRRELSSLPFKQGHNDGLNFPRELKSHKVIKAVKNDIERYIEIEMQAHKNIRTFQDSNLYHGFFEPLINKSNMFKNKSKIYYLKSINQEIPRKLYEPLQPFITDRLGGLLKEIEVDQEVITEDTAISYSTNNAEFFAFKVEEDDSYEELDDDPIIDTDEENEIGNDTFGDDDTFENELLVASQKKRIQEDCFTTTTTVLQLIKRQESTLSTKNCEFFDDFNNDVFSE